MSDNDTKPSQPERTPTAPTKLPANPLPNARPDLNDHTLRTYAPLRKREDDKEDKEE